MKIDLGLVVIGFYAIVIGLWLAGTGHSLFWFVAGSFLIIPGTCTVAVAIALTSRRGP